MATSAAIPISRPENFTDGLYVADAAGLGGALSKVACWVSDMHSPLMSLARFAPETARALLSPVWLSKAYRDWPLETMVCCILLRDACRCRRGGVMSRAPFPEFVRSFSARFFQIAGAALMRDAAGHRAIAERRRHEQRMDAGAAGHDDIDVLRMVG